MIFVLAYLLIGLITSVLFIKLDKHWTEDLVTLSLFGWPLLLAFYVGYFAEQLCKSLYRMVK